MLFDQRGSENKIYPRRPCSVVKRRAVSAQISPDTPLYWVARGVVVIFLRVCTRTFATSSNKASVLSSDRRSSSAVRRRTTLNHGGGRQRRRYIRRRRPLSLPALRQNVSQPDPRWTRGPVQVETQVSAVCSSVSSVCSSTRTFFCAETQTIGRRDDAHPEQRRHHRTPSDSRRRERGITRMTENK